MGSDLAVGLLCDSPRDCWLARYPSVPLCQRSFLEWLLGANRGLSGCGHVSFERIS